MVKKAATTTPKQQPASVKRVLRTYVLPELGVSVEAENVEEAVIKAKRKVKE